MGENGDSCYSGGLDGSVRCWKMPDLNVDPYDNYGQPSSAATVQPSRSPFSRGVTRPPLRPDPGIESSVLAGHEDSVWGLTYSTFHHRLASCSADGTVRIWDPQNSEPCLSVFNKERGRKTGNVSRLCVSPLRLHPLPRPCRARHAHLSGLRGYRPQSGCGVFRRRRDGAV